jgi:hypothetical protein
MNKAMFTLWLEVFGIHNSFSQSGQSVISHHNAYPPSTTQTPTHKPVVSSICKPLIIPNQSQPSLIVVEARNPFAVKPTTYRVSFRYYCAAIRAGKSSTSGTKLIHLTLLPCTERERMLSPLLLESSNSPRSFHSKSCRRCLEWAARSAASQPLISQWRSSFQSFVSARL